jgi:hypothetical protein
MSLGEFFYVFSGVAKLVIIAAGLLLGVYLVIFTLRQKRRFRIGSQLRQAPILMAGGASLLTPSERVGGYLVLTSKELLLFPHRANLEDHPIMSLPLQNVHSARAYLTWKFYPTGLAVRTAKGELKYWTYRHRRWARLINQQLG